MLDRLRAYPEAARHVVLGGYFALKHYLDYRETADVDGWWSSDTAPSDQKRVLECLRSIADDIARRHALTVKERLSKANDVASIEFQKDGRAIFSFQIVARANELRPPLTDQSPWNPISLETLDENIASKMNALVSRGAPRDFLDIRRLVQNRIISIDDAWRLWQAKNPGNDDLAEAKKQVIRRMHSIELRRPLDSIPKEERAAVDDARHWVYQELTRHTSNGENVR